MAQDSLYVIGIGGTGAKCIEAIVHMAAAGLLSDEPIKILFVDADETNGHLERARHTINVYQQCYKRLLGEQRQCKWLQTPLKVYQPDLWSPFGKTNLNKNLDSFFSYNNLQENHPALGHLFNVLFTEKERTATLDVGFRGRPAIGSAIMSQLDLNSLQEEPWSTLIADINSETGRGSVPKILLCGSIFGGTGAAGMPTLGQLLDDKLRNENLRDRVKIAGLFFLPYFQFPTPTGKESTDEVYASADKFLLNTEAALRYYNSQNDFFDSVYLLGNQNFTSYKFSIGKNTQRNEPHFLELYAALAARHFLFNSPSGTVVLNSRQQEQQVTWNDMPERSVVQTELVNATRFAYIWLASVKPDLDTAKQIGVAKFQIGAPWFVEFFRPSQGFMGKFLDKRGENLPDVSESQEQETINAITDWCRDYLRWLAEIHQSEGDEVLLFRYRAFANVAGQLHGDYLCDLTIGDNREQGLKQQDTVQQLQEKLSPNGLMPPNQGAVGLAKAFYLLCRL